MKFGQSVLDVVYIDGHAAVDGDGTTPATARNQLPLSTAEASNRVYLFRRNDGVPVIGTGNANIANATSRNVVFLGMPRRDEAMWDQVPEEARTAWLDNACLKARASFSGVALQLTFSNAASHCFGIRNLIFEVPDTGAGTTAAQSYFNFSGAEQWRGHRFCIDCEMEVPGFEGSTPIPYNSVCGLFACGDASTVDIAGNVISAPGGNGTANPNGFLRANAPNGLVTVRNNVIRDGTYGSSWHSEQHAIWVEGREVQCFDNEMSVYHYSGNVHSAFIRAFLRAQGTERVSVVKTRFRIEGARGNVWPATTLQINGSGTSSPSMQGGVVDIRGNHARFVCADVDVDTTPCWDFSVSRVVGITGIRQWQSPEFAETGLERLKVHVPDAGGIGAVSRDVPALRISAVPPGPKSDLDWDIRHRQGLALDWTYGDTSEFGSMSPMPMVPYRLPSMAGAVRVNRVPYLEIDSMVALGTRASVEATDSNVIVENLTGNTAQTLQVGSAIRSGVVIGKCNVDVTRGTAFEDSANRLQGVIVKSMRNTPGRWLAYGRRANGDVWPMTRTDGARASFRIINNAAAGNVDRFAIGFPGLRNFEVEPHWTGDGVVTVFLALGVGYAERDLSDMPALLRAIVTVPERRLASGVEGIEPRVYRSGVEHWRCDDSVWTGEPATPARIDIPVDGLRPGQKIDVRFEFTRHWNGELYLDPQLVLTPGKNVTIPDPQEPQGASAPVEGLMGIAPSTGMHALDFGAADESVGNGIASPVGLAAPDATGDAADKGKFLFVTSTDRYHLVTCSHGQTGVLLTVPELIARAAIPCGRCNPPALS